MRSVHSAQRPRPRRTARRDGRSRAGVWLLVVGKEKGRTMKGGPATVTGCRVTGQRTAGSSDQSPLIHQLPAIRWVAGRRQSQRAQLVAERASRTMMVYSNILHTVLLYFVSIPPRQQQRNSQQGPHADAIISPLRLLPPAAPPGMRIFIRSLQKRAAAARFSGDQSGRRTKGRGGADQDRTGQRSNEVLSP